MRISLWVNWQFELKRLKIMKDIKELIVWDDKYLTGIEIIDSQHKKIFQRLNELFESCKNQEEKGKILDLIQNLDFYTGEHFETEEKFMTDLEYPRYNEHKKAHEHFKDMYREIRNNYHYEKSQAVYVLAIHLYHTLAEWLDFHLSNEDHLLAEFLKDKV